MADTIDPFYARVCYDEGQAAFQRGDQLHHGPHRGRPGEAWAAGWRDAQEAVLPRPDGGPGPGCVVERPRPKIVQIAVLAEGEQVLPTLFALRDDGTLWYLFATGGPEHPWRQVRPIPDEETSDGR